MGLTFIARDAPLTPAGSALSLFLEKKTAGAAERDDVWPPVLRATLATHDVTEETLWAAWEVTTWAVSASVEVRRALACLVVALLETLDAGGTFLPLVSSLPVRAASHLDPLTSILARLGVGENERRAAAELAALLVGGVTPPSLAALIGPPATAAGSRRPFVLSGEGDLYPERLWWREEHLVTMLRERLTRVLPPLAAASSIDDSVAAVGASPGAQPMTPEQGGAIRAALANPMTMIAGGPGTGKTSTVVGLLRVLVRLGVPVDQIALAAPTGRAAQRMKEAVEGALARLEAPAPPDAELRSKFAGATTLHRLLGIRSGRARVLERDAPEFYADWPLPHRIVIVDEASMIDLALMERLVAAMAPAARLVLIGDTDQLPSVQAGAVFRDLVAGVPGSTRRLTRSHRMDPAERAGAEILRVASTINAGVPVPPDLPVLERAADLTFVGFERLAGASADSFLDRWHREVLGADANLAQALDRRYTLDDGGERLSPGVSGHDAAEVRALLDVLTGAKILCITRTAGSATSVAGVNRLLHARALALAAARAYGESSEAAPFIPGEPVIVLRNDHARGLSNGDLGMVVRIRGPRSDGLGVAFARATGVVVRPLDALRGHLALAYALTVHKAQGSEYQRVALMLPQVDVPLLTREIIYTALTRARHGVVVVGDGDLLSLAASRTLNRTSGIARRLAG